MSGLGDVRLRPARSTDAGKVGAILSAFIDETEWMPRLHSRAEDVSFAGMMIDRGWVTVAMVDDVPCGFIACEENEVNALYVLQDKQRAGLGSLLLGHVQDGRESLRLWTFQCNTQALGFYAKHGFQEVKRTDGASTEERLPDVQLRWDRGGKGQAS